MLFQIYETNEFLLSFLRNYCGNFRFNSINFYVAAELAL